MIPELIERTAVPYDDIGHIVSGTVIQESRTSNIAREAALTAGFPDRVKQFNVRLQHSSRFHATQLFSPVSVATWLFRTWLVG